MTVKRFVLQLPLGIVLVLLTFVTLARAQSTLPDVDFLLMVDLSVTDDWVRFQDEVISTPRNSARPVFITVVARRGESRSITVDEPHFTAEISTPASYDLVKVTVAGKVTSARTPGALTPFQQAIFDIQAGVIDNQLMLTYGPAVLKARFSYLKLNAP